MNQTAKPASKSNPTATTRQEIDACVKGLAKIIEKDPKKAAKLFESWLQEPANRGTKKRAA